MNRLLVLLFSVFLVNLLQAQQLPHISQYMNNNYVVNPAVAGMYDYYQVNTTIRNQWSGINDAPRTSVISIYGKHSDRVGLGGTVYNDVAGPTSKAGAAVSYTYSFPLTRSLNLSLALQGGFTQFKITKLGLTVRDPNDYLLDGGDIVRALPDATFGINISGDNWYIGGAIPQLLSSELKLMEKENKDFERIYGQDGELSRHIYVIGAYNYKINSIISIEPSFFLKSVQGAKTQIDFGIKSEYKQMIWAGMNYQMNNDLSSIAALLGYNINERFNIGYSYGVGSEIPSGSHEFMLGIRFPR